MRAPLDLGDAKERIEEGEQVVGLGDREADRFPVQFGPVRT